MHKGTKKQQNSQIILPDYYPIFAMIRNENEAIFPNRKISLLMYYLCIKQSGTRHNIQTSLITLDILTARQPPLACRAVVDRGKAKRPETRIFLFGLSATTWFSDFTPGLSRKRG